MIVLPCFNLTPPRFRVWTNHVRSLWRLHQVTPVCCGWSAFSPHKQSTACKSGKFSDGKQNMLNVVLVECVLKTLQVLIAEILPDSGNIWPKISPFQSLRHFRDHSCSTVAAWRYEHAKSFRHWHAPGQTHWQLPADLAVISTKQAIQPPHNGQFLTAFRGIVPHLFSYCTCLEPIYWLSGRGAHQI